MPTDIFPDHWQYRLPEFTAYNPDAPHGWDWGIYDSVVIHNEYELPNPLPPNSLVIDIGAHIGSFAWAANLVGASKFVCYELCEENYKLLKANLLPLGDRVICRHGPVWHDEDRTQLYDPVTPDENTGGHNVYNDYGKRIESYPITGVIKDALKWSGYDRVKVLKLDCEGSEFPILIETDLSLIDSIFMEVHDGFTWRGKAWTAHDLVPLLDKAGFRLKIVSTGSGFWKIIGFRSSF